jgi:hypothetical protein
MFQLAGPIEREARKIIGTCDDVTFFSKMTESVQLVANGGEFEGWKGYLDICTDHEIYVTTPREVGTVLGVNIGGKPTLGHDQVFNFHLNGPGDCGTQCEYSWQDLGAWHATYRDPLSPERLSVELTSPADNGKLVEVYGTDSVGATLSRTEGGLFRNGLRLPTMYGVSIPEASSPAVARIAGFHKEETVGPVKLWTESGRLLATYEPDEVLPQYRRMKLGRRADWVRIFYRKANPEIRSRYDHIPLLSRTAFLSAIRAVKWRGDSDYTQALEWEADAQRLELQAQAQLEAPLLRPMQVSDRVRMLGEDRLE